MQCEMAMEIDKAKDTKYPGLYLLEQEVILSNEVFGFRIAKLSLQFIMVTESTVVDSFYPTEMDLASSISLLRYLCNSRRGTLSRAFRNRSGQNARRIAGLPIRCRRRPSGLRTESECVDRIPSQAGRRRRPANMSSPRSNLCLD